MFKRLKKFSFLQWDRRKRETSFQMKECHALTTGLGFRPGEGKVSTGTDFLFKTSPDVGFFWLQQTQLGRSRGHKGENSSCICSPSLSGCHMGFVSTENGSVRRSSGGAQGKHHLGISISNRTEHFKNKTLQNLRGRGSSDQMPYPNAMLGTIVIVCVKHEINRFVDGNEESWNVNYMLHHDNSEQSPIHLTMVVTSWLCGQILLGGACRLVREEVIKPARWRCFPTPKTTKELGVPGEKALLNSLFI